MDNKPRVEVVVPTKNRYEFLSLLLHSLTNQTYDNWDVLIVDDSDKPINMTQLPFVSPLLNYMRNNDHEWRVLFGAKAGPHKCHQIALDNAKQNLLLRVDDDCLMSPNFIEILVNLITEKEHCSAVGGLVIDPNLRILEQVAPENWKELKEFSGKIWEENGKPCHSPALQWLVPRDKEIKKVEHIHSTFLYKKAVALAIGGWSEMDLSKVGMTEETWFTYKMHLAGWNMYINPEAIVWHLKAPVGGCRSDKEKEDLTKLYMSDRRKFDEWYEKQRDNK
jgi:GT2 family glycosyltransferase